MVLNGSKQAVSLRHDVIPTGPIAGNSEGAILRLGKQLKELSVCAAPRREGAVITSRKLSPSSAYTTGGRVFNTAGSVQVKISHVQGFPLLQEAL